MTVHNWVTGLALGLRLVSGQASPNSETKLPDAATILDRYVEVTGGAQAYRKVSFEREETSMALPNGSEIRMTSLRSRDGRSEMSTESSQISKHGVSKGIAWEISPSSGPRVLTGDAEKSALARSRSMDVDTWRDEYPKVETVGEQAVEGKMCFRVKLVRTDESVVEEYFDKQTNLLTRVEESSDGAKITMDVEAWTTQQGIKYPSAFLFKRGPLQIPLTVTKVEYMKSVPSGVLQIPKEVEQVIKPATGTLPNAADLMDRYIESTGGAKAYSSVKTQTLKAVMTFALQGLKADLVANVGEGGKSYTTMELPGAGKFEFGSDGKTSWQKNVMQGPQLTPKEQSGAMFGLSSEDLAKWRQAYEKIETVSRAEVNGSPCYLVKMISKLKKEESTACFDTASGFMVKLTTASEVQGNKIPIDMVMSDYRPEGPLKFPHRMETSLIGQPITVEVTEVAINPPLPESMFVLPPDVQALVDQTKKDADAAGDKKNPPK